MASLPKVTGKDRAFGRAWARAYRTGKPTKDIVANWLAGVRGPKMIQRLSQHAQPYRLNSQYVTASTCMIGTITNTQLGFLGNALYGPY